MQRVSKISRGMTTWRRWPTRPIRSLVVADLVAILSEYLMVRMCQGRVPERRPWQYCIKNGGGRNINATPGFADASINAVPSARPLGRQCEVPDRKRTRLNSSLL